jgi:hypothetical protein
MINFINSEYITISVERRLISNSNTSSVQGRKNIKSYSLHLRTVSSIISKSGLGTHLHHINHPNLCPHLIMEPQTKLNECKVNGCIQSFSTTALLKTHQAEQHCRIPCLYAHCSVSFGRKFDMNRHCKNQHQTGKEACLHGCGYTQRRDKMQSHLKICDFRRGISIYSCGLEHC